MELLVAAVAVAVAVGATAVVANVRRRYRRDNQVVPGVRTSAPPEWAGAHTRPARLHRDLRDTIRAMHRIPGAHDELDDARRAIEHEALTIDDQLVAVAALPPRLQSQPMARLDEAVRALEAAVAELASRQPPTAVLTAEALDEALERQRLLEQARAELDDLDAGWRSTTGVDPLDRGAERPGRPGQDGDEPQARPG